MGKAKWTTAVVAILLCTGTALAAPTPQEKCDGARIKAWRTYVSCVELILAKEAGELPVNPSQFAAFAKCRHTYFKKWATLQGAAYAGSTCIGSRFTDNGDGTVTDNLSMLTWEKKVDYDTIPTGNWFDADDLHEWSNGAPWKEDGSAFSSLASDVNLGGFGGADGWRLPSLAELQTILLDFPCTAASCTCPSAPCIDPALDATNTLLFLYWSATSHVSSPTAWTVQFDGADVDHFVKTSNYAVRAARGGL